MWDLGIGGDGMTENKRFVKYDGNTIVDLKLVKSWIISNGNVELLLEILNDETSKERISKKGDFELNEKRFKIKLSHIGELVDCETKTILAVHSIASELIPLCDLLNAQHEEIQQSKVLIKKYHNENTDLIKENEQLKSEIETLHEQLAHLDLDDVILND